MSTDKPRATIEVIYRDADGTTTHRLAHATVWGYGVMGCHPDARGIGQISDDAIDALVNLAKHIPEWIADGVGTCTAFNPEDMMQWAKGVSAEAVPFAVAVTQEERLAVALRLHTFLFPPRNTPRSRPTPPMAEHQPSVITGPDANPIASSEGTS